MNRVYNFAPGPAVLPEPVLKKASEELVCYKDKGMSVMEMSHRSKMFMEIYEESQSLLRELMNIPDNYKILYIQGGASMQFTMVPMNLFSEKKTADYMMTGEFAKKAVAEAKKLGTVRVVASSEEEVFNHIPELKQADLDLNADYFHFTMNNTIFGTRFNEIPKVSVPLVTDMSSCILSQEYDVSKFGVIYAGAQKNIGPSGLTVVIVREDLIGKAPANTPSLLNWKTYAENDSMFNTPPTYGIYMAKLVFEWLKDLGGVPAIQKVNEMKAGLLYDFLDNSKMFKSTVVPKDRSMMNVPFVTPNADLDKKFIADAAKEGILNIAGHRLVGGMRASIYNAMPVEGVKALIEFMKKFETENK